MNWVGSKYKFASVWVGARDLGKRIFFSFSCHVNKKSSHFIHYLNSYRTGQFHDISMVVNCHQSNFYHVCWIEVKVYSHFHFEFHFHFASWKQEKRERRKEKREKRQSPIWSFSLPKQAIFQASQWVKETETKDTNVTQTLTWDLIKSWIWLSESVGVKFLAQSFSVSEWGIGQRMRNWVNHLN